jgi:hypothetical protein
MVPQAPLGLTFNWYVGPFQTVWNFSYAVGLLGLNKVRKLMKIKGTDQDACRSSGVLVPVAAENGELGDDDST